MKKVILFIYTFILTYILGWLAFYGMESESWVGKSGNIFVGLAAILAASIAFYSTQEQSRKIRVREKIRDIQHIISVAAMIVAEIESIMQRVEDNNWIAGFEAEINSGHGSNPCPYLPVHEKYFFAYEGNIRTLGRMKPEYAKMVVYWYTSAKGFLDSNSSQKLPRDTDMPVLPINEMYSSLIHLKHEGQKTVKGLREYMSILQDNVESLEKSI